MRSRYHLYILSIIALIATSCGTPAFRSDHPSLVAIDSLVLQYPDSACKLLAAIPSDSLQSDDQRAYHALLTTIAQYKAYYPITSDSIINIALNHYNHNGANPNKRMRSLLYKGCVMNEMGDTEAAMTYYKEAKRVCEPYDYFYEGFINMRIAELYQRALNDSIPLNLYQEALSNFRKAGNNHYTSLTLNFVGTSYILNNADSATHYIKESVRLSKVSNDSAMTFDGLASLCSLYYNNKQYEKVVGLAYELIYKYGRFARNRVCNDYIAISFAKSDAIDSAYSYFNAGLPAINIEDTISMYQATAEIALAKGTVDEYIEYNQKAVNMADSLLLANQAAILREVELKYEKEKEKVGYIANQKRQILIISCLGVGVLLAVCLILILRVKLRYARKEILEAFLQLNNMKKLIEQQTSENKKYLLQLNIQEEKLKKAACDASLVEESMKQLSQFIIVQEKTQFCINEILRYVFYNGRHKSEAIIADGMPIKVSDIFWQTLDEILAIKYCKLMQRLNNENILLSKTEKKVFALCAINMPNAIIRRILNYKSVQIVSNYRHKLATKILGEGHKLEEIL